jgi:hypothetical protein
MRFKCIKAGLVGLVLSVCGVANAGLIHSASSIIDAPPPLSSYSADRTIDQTGLTKTYVSGVTDFDTFLGLNPKHRDAGSPISFFASSFTRSANVDFDMGSILNLTKLVLWNYPSLFSAGIIDFSIYSSTTSNFLMASLLGTFNADDEADNRVNAAQVFDFTDTQSRYLRLSITSTANGTNVGFSEIAFEASSTPAVLPEPSTLAIFVLGVLGFASRRFKK